MGVGGFMTRAEMVEAATALDQALYVHEQWCNAVYCALICRLRPDERDLSDSPHRRCSFGQWYYAHADSRLTEHPGFIAIEVEHEQMHGIAARILMTSHAGESVTVRDYDSFVNSITRLRTEILGLRHELDEAMTNLDPLTGAQSRIGMLSKLRLQQATVKREVQTCAIAMIDLDHFKRVNDEFGHQAGDAVLTETVRYVLTHLRPYDELFRYGGEEFLVWFPGTDLETGHVAIEGLRKGITMARFDIGDGAQLQMTASCGLTLLDPDVPVEQSIARADRALYRAKELGRDQTCTWDSSMG